VCQIGCDLTFVFPPNAGAKERVTLIEGKESDRPSGSLQ
jgi:hypothetical protein